MHKTPWLSVLPSRNLIALGLGLKPFTKALILCSSQAFFSETGGKPGKMSTYLNMNIIWLEKKHLYIHELCFNIELSQKMPAVTCTNAWKKIRAHVSNVAAAQVSSRQIKSDMFPDGINTSSRENDGNIFCLTANIVFNRKSRD